MPGGSTTISSILKPPEDSLLALEDPAFGAAPRIRHLLPRCPFRDAVPGIALGRVVNIMAFKTDPPCILRIRWHFSFQPLFSKTYQSGFSSENMNTFFRATFPGQEEPCAEKTCRAQSRATRRGSGIFPSRVKSRQNRAASGYPIPAARR